MEWNALKTSWGPIFASRDSACGLLLKTNKENKTKQKKKQTNKTKQKKPLKRQEIHNIFIKTNDITHGDVENLLKRTAADKVLRDKASNIATIFNLTPTKYSSCGVKSEIVRNEEYLKNYTNKLLENLKK